MDRLAPMTLSAGRIVDLGTATGAAIPALRKRFPRARVHGVDLSPDMLRQQPSRLFSRRSLVCADAAALPFVDDSIDLVFANQLLSFTDDVAGVCREIGRVLSDDGIFAFALLGPDSFGELRAAWRRVDDTAHVASFPDMHNVGDALVRAGLRDPVLDVDRLRLQYATPAALYRDLAAVAARNSLADRARGLTGRVAGGEMSALDAGIDGPPQAPGLRARAFRRRRSADARARTGLRPCLRWPDAAPGRAGPDKPGKHRPATLIPERIARLVTTCTLFRKLLL